MSSKVIIPFRDRGIDPRRAANLEVVMAWWYAHGFEPHIQSDGLSGDAQFNRHRAYNRAVERFPETDVFVFTEADMLIHPKQVIEGITWALKTPGLVVPFTQYRYWSDAMTEMSRNEYHDYDTEYVASMWSRPVEDHLSWFSRVAESTMDNGQSIGAVNIVSRRTLEMTGGFTEATHGNWYDDNITAEGFAFLTGSSTRFVAGPAVHMYHLPGHTGTHLTQADMDATEHNRRLLEQMRIYIEHDWDEPVHRLMSIRVTP